MIITGDLINLVVTILIVFIVLVSVFAFIFSQYRKILRQAKNYERGLKMVPMHIHIPPTSEDKESNGRDERDLVEEVLSEAQVLYDIIASTYQKGFKNDKIYGQRHISFEIVACDGQIQYCAVVPAVLTDTVRQAVASAYPSARLEEVRDRNIFSQVGKIEGTVGGEFSLKKEYAYPIATYRESRRDVTRAMLNALSTITKEEGAVIQVMFRPAKSSWTKNANAEASRIKKEKGSKKKGPMSIFTPKEMFGLLWKPPEATEVKPEDKQLTAIEQSMVEAIEEKTKYPGYETLIRLIVSSSNTSKSQAILKNLVSAFSLFDSANCNGFKFSPAKDIEELVTAFIFRFFPQSSDKNILNSLELATIYHLPSQDNIPTSQLEREMAKQVDGPNQPMTEGLLIGVNEFRGVKKEIRLTTNDRRRHVYFIGQTGTGKSVLLENLAYQDMVDGKGFAFIDPHGDSAEKLMGMVPKERVEDIIYFDPGNMSHPIGLNMFEFKTPDQKDFLIQEAINMLYSLYDPGHQGIVGPRLEHIFRNCALLLMSDPTHTGTFIDVPRVLVDENFRNSKLPYVTDQMVIDFWTKEFPASQRSNEAGEIISWVVAKFGPFMSNEAMRNIIGQEKSGFNLRDIMDNKKILLVNLSKGRMGDFNSKLLGIIFVMQFQAAAMSRADMPEDDRQDFSLYVDEFQNFATESFSTILSEARKYRLSLILANQFMTQLNDSIREAVIGNIGTIISGRLGITDAEVLEKRFLPVFNADDLTRLPNYKSITTVLINGVPSSAFSMSLVPPMVKSNLELQEAMKKFSATKYGLPREQVERDIKARLGAGSPEAKSPPANPTGPEVIPQTIPQPNIEKPEANDKISNVGDEVSFLDDWLSKRKKNTPQQNKEPNDNKQSKVGIKDTNSINDQSLQPNIIDKAVIAEPTESIAPAKDNSSSEEEMLFKIRR